MSRIGRSGGFHNVFNTKSAVDAAGVYTDTATVGLAFTPSTVETVDYADSGIEAFALTPSAVELKAKEYTETATEAFALTPSSAEIAQYTESGIEAFALTPSATELKAHDYTDAATETFSLTPSVTETAQFVDTNIEVYLLTPGGVESTPGVDSVTEPFKLTPIGTELIAVVDAVVENFNFTISSTELANFVDQAIESLILTPITSIELREIADANTEVLALTPSAAETAQLADTATENFALTPSGTEFRAVNSSDTATEVFALTPSGVDVADYVDPGTIAATRVARLFDESNSDVAVAPSLPISNYPLTMSCWAKATSFYATQTAFSVGEAAPIGNRYIAVGFLSSGECFCEIRDGAGVHDALGSAIQTVGDWVHLAVTIDSGITSSSPVSVYVNGVLDSTDTGDAFVTTMDNVVMGAISYLGYSSFFDGAIADCALWNTVLTDPQIAQLAAGDSPAVVDPGDLVGYWPLNGNSPEDDLIANNDAVLTGTTTVLIGDAPFNPTVVSAVIFALTPSTVSEIREISDTGTEVLALTPSGVDVYTSGAVGYTDTAVEVFNLTPTASESVALTDTNTEIFALTPITAAEDYAKTGSDSGIEVLALTPTSAETYTRVDTAVENFSLVPSSVDVLTTEYTDTAVIPLALVPNSTEIREHSDTAIETFALTPSSTDIRTTEYLDAATEVFALIPSSTEIYVRAGADVGTENLALTPSAIETAQTVDTAIELFALTASASEGAISPTVDAATANLLFTITSLEVIEATDTVTALVKFTPSSTDVYTIGPDTAIEYLALTPAVGVLKEVAVYVDTATVRLLLVPSAVELFVPTGARAGSSLRARSTSLNQFIPYSHDRVAVGTSHIRATGMGRWRVS